MSGKKPCPGLSSSVPTSNPANTTLRPTGSIMSAASPPVRVWTGLTLAGPLCPLLRNSRRWSNSSSGTFLPPGELFEYEDDLNAPTRENAPEFITRAIEDGAGSLAKRENYVDYIARRPRAERFGAHGLFTGGDDPLALSRVADTVAAHPGNVWLPIISLRREDAARLGYDNAGQRKDLLTSYAPQLADAMKIPFDRFRWYAAFHNEGHHPHIHMVCCGADSKAGFRTKEGIANIKSGLAKELFRQELTAVYRRHLINAAHNLGGLRVNHPKAGIVRVLDIATGRREQRYAGIAFHFVHDPALLGNIAGVPNRTVIA